MQVDSTKAALTFQGKVRRLMKWTPITLVDRMFFTKHLSVMLRGGFTLSKALDTLSKQTTKERFRNIILDIKNNIESGMAFYQAMERYSHIFGTISVNMIEVGETSGKLDLVLMTLSEQMEKDHALRSKVKNAMMYPAVVSMAMGFVAVLMFLFVLPQLTSVYSEADVKLPLATRVLIFANEWVLSNAIFAIVLLALFSFIVYKILKTKRGKYIFDVILLKIPIFAPLVKKINLAHFSRLLYSLLHTDVPIDKSFTLVSGTLGNSSYAKYLEEVSPLLREGKSVVDSLERNPKLFPPVVTQMLAVGEESGTLDEMSKEIAEFYEEEVNNVLNNLASIIEPLLILFLGAGAAGIALAVIMPIYSLVDVQ